MESKGTRKGSYQKSNLSGYTPSSKKSKTREKKQQDRNSAGDNNIPTSLESSAMSTPTTLATPVSSKRQVKRATVLTATGDIGSNDKAKGLVRIHGGSLQHFLKSSEEWVPAVYHNDIREELIVESEAFGDYDHPRAKGLGEYDVTSFLPAQKTWGTARQDWPDVLFQIVPGKGTYRTARNVKPWYRDGKVLLDQDNNPVNDFIKIPATLSAELEGQHMEAMCRLDSRIKQADFRARMPHMIIIKAGKPAIQLFTLNTISMRMSRFRDQAALISREKRAGSKSLEKNLRKLLPKSCFEENSTKAFGRLLTRKEVAEVKSVNKGKFGYRVRDKDEEEEEEEEEEATGIPSTAGPSRKRTRVMTEDGNDDQNSEIHITTPEPSREKRSRRAEVHEPDWSSVIDPILDMVTPCVPDFAIQNQHLQAQACTQPWSPANDDYFKDSDNAYSTNPGHEYALSVPDDNIPNTSATPNLGSDEGFSQLQMLTNKGGSTADEYGTPITDTLAMKQLAGQNQHGDTGRLTHELYRQSHSHIAALTPSVSQHQPENTVNVHAPHNTNFATDTVTTTPSAKNSENTETWDDTLNGDWTFYDRAMFNEWDPAQYTYPIFNGTVYSHGSGQYEPKESIHPVGHALQNALFSELGRVDANGVIPGEEPLETDADPNFSFTDYLNHPDPGYDDQEFVTIGGL
ncbi:hypothetical protein MMC17_003785 [Xylographa soralifera]|nr:hypothetical protein [Xylographa soralifera]